MRRAVLLSLLFLLVTAGHAQFGNRVRSLLNGDSLAPPDHDTAYITTYRSRLVLSLLTKYSYVDVDLEHGPSDHYTFLTNSNEQYGVGLNYKWLSAEVTFNVPLFNQYDASLGKTESRGFGLGYTGRRLWARGFWNTAEGFYLEDPERWIDGWTEGQAPIVRPDISNTAYLLSVNYALSGKRRYSQNAALFQMERQKRSAGTFVAGVSAWLSDVQGDSSLVRPALQDTFQLATGFTRVKRSLAGVTFGYTHTFAFWHKGFIHVAVLPGLAYVKQTIVPTEGEDLVGEGAAAAVSEFKLGAGFNGDRWYTALTTSFYYSSVDIAENLSLATNYGFIRVALGMRFGGPNIKALGKVGL